MQPHPSMGVHQYHLIRKKIEGQLRDPPDEELLITLPKSVHIQELDPFSAAAQDAMLAPPGLALKRDSGNDQAPPETPAVPKTAEEQGPWFSQIRISVEYVIENPREGIHFVGLEEGDNRFPHVYSLNSMFSGAACCLFPCVDDPLARCLWEISIRCARTLGDAFNAVGSAQPNGVMDGQPSRGSLANGLKNRMNANKNPVDQAVLNISLSEEEKTLDLTVVCSGDLTDEVCGMDRDRFFS